MGLSRWPIFKAGIFRQAKYLVSSPQKAQRTLEILETGVIGIELLPMQTGFVKASTPEVKKAWMNIHALKFQVYKDGQPTQDESVIVISERSHIPLDPLNVLKPKDREKLASLDDIAVLRHDDAMVDSAPNMQLSVQRMIINLGFIFLFFLGLVYLVKGC